MLPKMEVYEVERELGLEEVIRQGSSITLASLAQPDPNRFSNQMRSVATNDQQEDLYYLKSILVTTGINKNDDYFDRNETWKARSTPEDKQFNLSHNSLDIIGHITDCIGVDDELKVLASDEDLPEKFHILISSVLYKYWSDSERQKMMDKTIAEIEDGKWFVSMECLFSNFDYVLIDTSGKQQIINRNNSTAFLTKHLRVYGGSGTYQDKKVGRVLRNFIFSGVGLVENPANPESVILSTAEENLDLGYSLEDSKNQEKIMEDLETKNQELAAKAQELEAKTKELTELNAKLSELEATLATLEKFSAEQVKANEELQSQLKEIAKAKRDAERLASVKAAFGFEDDEAKEMVETLDVLSDELFAKHITKTSAKLKVKPKEVDETEGVTLDGVKPSQEPALAVETNIDSGVSEVRSDINNFLTTTKNKK